MGLREKKGSRDNTLRLLAQTSRCYLTKYGTFKEEKVKFEAFEEAFKKTCQVGHWKGLQFKRGLWTGGEPGQASVCQAPAPQALWGWLRQSESI